MENLVFQLKSFNRGKFGGIFIAFAIIFIVLLVPALPSWLIIFALYPLVTSVIDMVLYFKS